MFHMWQARVFWPDLPRQSCMEGTLWKAKVAFQTKFHCFAGMGANTRQSCETQWSQSIGLSAAMEKTAALCLCMPKASWLPMCHGLCYFAAKIQQPCGFPWSMPQCVRMLFLGRIDSHAAIVQFNPMIQHNAASQYIKNIKPLVIVYELDLPSSILNLLLQFHNHGQSSHG